MRQRRQEVEYNPAAASCSTAREKIATTVENDSFCWYEYEFRKKFCPAATVKALTQLGHTVRASKITGTASLKDIMNMGDAGAEKISDFTYVGHPSTYMLSKDEVMDIFNKLDLKYANKASNYWVVEIADGIIQRETAMLLSDPDFKARMHKIVFCAGDALGALSGKRLLKDKFDINVDMISGVFTAAPLHVRELKGFTRMPILTSAHPDLEQVRRELT